MAFPDNLRSLGELRSRYRRARRGGQAGLGQVLGSAAATNVAAARGPVHILPVPSSQTTSPVDFRDTSRLIDQGHQLTTRWLASQREDRPAPPDLPAVRVARAS